MKQNRTRKLMKGRGWFNGCRGKTCSAKTPERNKTPNFVTNNPMRKSPTKTPSPSKVSNNKLFVVGNIPSLASLVNTSNKRNSNFVENSKLSELKNDLRTAKTNKNTKAISLLEKIVQYGTTLQKVRKRINELKLEKNITRAKNNKTNQNKQKVISLADRIEKFKKIYDEKYKVYINLIKQYEDGLLSEL